MQNFVLHNPTKIIFGADRIQEIGPESRAFGCRALLVYGKESIKENGIFEMVTSSLEQQGMEIVLHGGVQSNPLLSHVREGIAKAKEEQSEVIIAVGGGSVIDSAKAISAGALVTHDVWKFFTGKKSIKKCLPLTTVLTLAAAGSEMNGGMVLSHDEKKLKFGTGNKRLHPAVSILDPTATYSVPPAYTAYGAVDAIAHILEFYFTTSDAATPVQDRFMEGLIINIMQSCDKVLGQPEDYQGRADLMWCATLALNGWTAAGLGLVGFPMHMVAHTLGALHNVPHGAGLSVVMPAWLNLQAKTSPHKYGQFAKRVFQVEVNDPQRAAQEGIRLLKKWFEKIGCPTSLAELKIDPADIPFLAEQSLPLAALWRLKKYNKEKIETILRSCA
ncbi:MAG: iron-containing alcohol dehydrogenase [Deltaproteobacteria bacterium]|jgi:alcohol dehydrogenase YqhD (iron-dependent ADH family)|nr:iron-containing alcohol dehydrogenase [Deltaproteobacteria bacterium]